MQHFTQTTNFARLPVIMSIMCVDFSAFLKVFLIFHFYFILSKLSCLDTGTAIVHLVPGCPAHLLLLLFVLFYNMFE